jgi:lipopolysaccharide/colanic/teichoic acid biosynthesis glycosyltransferase
MMRRLIDLVAALLILPVLSPVMLFASLAIVLESPGSPFYRARRVGKDGAPFRMWKLRTMVRNANQIGGAITACHDSRITRVGWFLRKTKLDEIPQFFNLLLGDVTLIGPRPEDPAIVSNYTPEQRHVLAVKPGITGPTQLRYTIIEAEMIPGNEDPERFYAKRLLNDKLRLDLEYINSRTFFSDCRVVLKTISHVARAFKQS